MRKLPIGTKVKTIMGCRQYGVVISSVGNRQYTDGSYRPPYPNQKVVYVKWDDGTVGWMPSHYVTLDN